MNNFTTNIEGHVIYRPNMKASLDACTEVELVIIDDNWD